MHVTAASRGVGIHLMPNYGMKPTAGMGAQALDTERPVSPAAAYAERYPYKRDEEVRQLTDLETVSA